MSKTTIGRVVIYETCPECAAKRTCPCCGKEFVREARPVVLPVTPGSPWPTWPRPYEITWGQRYDYQPITSSSASWSA